MSAGASATPVLQKVRTGLVYSESSSYLVVHEELRRAVGGDFGTAAILSALEFRSRMYDGQFQITVAESLGSVCEGRCAARAVARGGTSWRLRPAV